MSQASYQIKTTDWALQKKAKFARDLLDNIFTFLKGRKKVVEIGPGLGHFADECVQDGMDYLAVEPSEELSKVLEARGISVIQKTVPPIPAPDHSTDFLFANHVLEHQPHYVDAMNFLLEVKRVLRPGGYACISFPNWIKTKNSFHEMDYSHNFITTGYRVSQMMQNADLQWTTAYHTNGQMMLRQGFFGWVKRIPAMFVLFIANRNIVSVIAEYSRVESLLGKVRKTVSASIYVIVRA